MYTFFWVMSVKTASVGRLSTALYPDNTGMQWKCAHTDQFNRQFSPCMAPRLFCALNSFVDSGAMKINFACLLNFLTYLLSSLYIYFLTYLLLPMSGRCRMCGSLAYWAQSAEPVKMLFGGVDSYVSREPCIRWGSRPPWEGVRLRETFVQPIVTYIRMITLHIVHLLPVFVCLLMSVVRWVMVVERSSCCKLIMKANVTVFLNKTFIRQWRHHPLCRRYCRWSIPCTILMCYM